MKRRLVMTIKTPGKPKIRASKTSGIVGNSFFCPSSLPLFWKGVKMACTTTNTVKAMAAGSTIVPTRSMNTTNRIEKQNVPQRSRTWISSNRLCTVELIHRRRCERSTRNVSGTTVLHTADGWNIIFRFGKVLSMSVVRYRSSPRSSRFFLCRVSTTFSE